jgi:uncharacterized protein (TIGR02466 family)
MFLDLFPTRIYLDKVSDYDVIQSDLTEIESGIEWENLWDTHYISDKSFTKTIVPDSLGREIAEHVVRYTGRDDFRITASWMTRLEPGQYAVAHQHGHSDLSGVYYFKTNGEEGNLYFMNPALAATTSIWSQSKNYHDIQPIQGSIVLFPGYLTHGIKTNTSHHDRLSLSFNIVFQR